MKENNNPFNNFEPKSNPKKKSSFLVFACIGVCVVSIVILIIALVLNENGSFSSFISSNPFKGITSQESSKKEKEEKKEVEEEEPEEEIPVEEEQIENPEEPETKPEENNKPKEEHSSGTGNSDNPSKPPVEEPSTPVEPPISREQQIRNNPDYIYYMYIDLPNNSNFDPKGPLTRADYAKWIALALHLDTNINIENPFPDLAGYEQYKKYILAVYKEGYMLGTGTNFEPGGYITRIQALNVVNKIIEKNNLYPDEFCEELVFTDTSGKTATIATKGAKYCVTKGYSSTSFKPNINIERQDAVLFLYRGLKRDHPNMECVSDPLKVFNDVSTSSSRYTSIGEATVNHYCVYK